MWPKKKGHPPPPINPGSTFPEKSTSLLCPPDASSKEDQPPSRANSTKGRSKRTRPPPWVSSPCQELRGKDLLCDREVQFLAFRTGFRARSERSMPGGSPAGLRVTFYLLKKVLSSPAGFGGESINGSVFVQRLEQMETTLV